MYGSRLEVWQPKSATTSVSIDGHVYAERFYTTEEEGELRARFDEAPQGVFCLISRLYARHNPVNRRKNAAESRGIEKE